MRDAFVFDGMTPELLAYLDHCGKPHEGDAYDPWREEFKRLHALVPADVMARYDADHKRWVCRDETQEGEPRTHASPSGRYRLVVTRHAAVEVAWAHSKGRVYDGERLVAEVCRNYHAFLFCFVEGHPNGHDYLVTGEDYQGQTFVELDTGRRIDHLPASAAQGFGFCWSSIHPSPSKRTLAVNGCFWACPYEVWLVDFADPMSGTPIVLRHECDAERFIGWIDGAECDTATLGPCYRAVYIANNKTLEECTPEEREEWDRRDEAGEKVTGHRTDPRVTWIRKSDVDTAREYVEYLRRGWSSNVSSIPGEFADNARRLLGRLDVAERTAIDPDGAFS